MEDRRMLFILTVLCVTIVAGGVTVALHPASAYSSSVSATDDGFSYSVGGGSAAEYNIAISSNSSESVDTLYIYCDSAYGSKFDHLDDAVARLQNRLSDAGFQSKTINTSKLVEVVAQPSEGVGIVMGSGTIPEEVVGGELLSWVKSGGTLYWTWDIIGCYAAKSDGTYYALEESVQKDFLGADCTSTEIIRATSTDTSNGYSRALSLCNNFLYGGLDTSLLPGAYLSFGYASGDVREITLVSCGSGTVAVVSGDNDMYQTTDLVRLICSGAQAGSELVFSEHLKVSLGQTIGGTATIAKTPGMKYSVFVFVSGTNIPYGNVIGVEA